MQKTIRFQTESQVIIFKCELLGQISDGYWENSTPHDHYKSFSDIDVKTDVQVGKNFFTKRKYNFANKMLIDVVGDRMIAYVQFFQAFPNINMDDHHSYPMSTELHAVNKWAYDIFNPSQEHYKKRSERVLANFPNVKTHQELSTQIMQAVNKFKYDKKSLRKDLLQMSKVVNT